MEYVLGLLGVGGAAIAASVARSLFWRLMGKG